MALFGSGPRSNILQTVAPMYQGMIDAEKQKGVAMREAMGAFGKAIDPKTIGMRKFKQEFADADWTKPETFFRASKALAFDPPAAMDMAARGQQLQASMVPKRDMQIVERRNTQTGEMEKVAVDMASVQSGTVFGASEAKERNPLMQAQAEYTEALSTLQGQLADDLISQEQYDLEKGRLDDLAGFPTTDRTPTTMARQVSEAYGLEVGSSAHQKIMQDQLNKKNTVTNLPTQLEQINTVRKFVESNPTYKNAQERRIKIQNAQALIPEVRAGNESAVPLLERTVSDIYNTDTRAASEIDRLVQKKSWSTGFQDWLEMGFKGTLSDATVKDLEQMVTIMDQSMSASINEIVDLEHTLYKDVNGIDSTQLARTMDTFRVLPNEPSNLGDATLSRVKASSQPPVGTEDGIHVDSSGNRMEVINGVAYEL